MTVIATNKPVLVTGASGYVAGWLIRALLEKGLTVHATVRDPAKASSVRHLEALANSLPGELKLFKADLLQPGSFDIPMEGCELVFHTASPFVMTGFKDANEALLRPALEGTRNVLDAVNRCDTVKRVVLTSSVAATYGDAIDSRDVPRGTFNESHWNTSSSEHHQPYLYSKTIAEQEAWKMQRAQNRWELVCINPALVIGHSLTPASQSASITTLQQFGDGTLRFGAPEMWNGLVDVRDVADAHVRAGFTPEAHGRYIICAESLSLLDMGKALRQHFGSRYPFPRRSLPKLMFWLVAPVVGFTRDFVARNIGYPLAFDNQRSRRELGMSYRDVRKGLQEHFQQLIDDGLVKKR